MTCTHFVLLLAIASALPVGAAESVDALGRVLTTAEEIQRLSREEALRKFPALIRGVVICTVPELQAAVIQDSTRGIYVTHLDEVPAIGESIEVQGVTDPGYFAPIVRAGHMTRLGRGTLPQPIRPTWDELINGSLDSQYVELHGIVTAIHGGGVTLLTRGGKIAVALHDIDSASLAKYREGLVRIRGCLFASWSGATRQLRTDEVRFYGAQVTLEEPPPANLFATTAKRAAELLLFDSQASALRRVKVSGQITHTSPGNCT